MTRIVLVIFTINDSRNGNSLVLLTMSVVGQPDVVLGYEKLQAEFSKPSEKIGVTLPQVSERVSKAEIPNNLKLLFKHH